MATGLTSVEAQRRLAEFGENRISSQRRTGALALFIAQFKSPIILILIGPAYNRKKRLVVRKIRGAFRAASEANVLGRIRYEDD